jgi:DNA invertase Pin-like site-specific DNA recombinase
MRIVEPIERPAERAEQTDDALIPAETAAAFGRQKIEPRHVERLAIVYVRQSDPQQVLKHRESTAVQYNLVELAARLGWPRERILVIDDDQGLTGQHAEGRHGFQRMMAEVAMDHVGIIVGREMSRLARSCKDWYQLLEVCGLFKTVLADQDRIYDPADYHDRLLLGLTGIMSEAELHVMRGRLQTGLLNKARRGALFLHMPIGYILSPTGEVMLDPDEQVQAVVRLVFEKFEELGSIAGLLRYMARHEIRLGVRPHKGPNRGKLEWHRPSQPSLRNMLRHPLYAGAYVYGRRKTDPRRNIPGRPTTGRTLVPRNQWSVLLRDRHPAYITWQQFEAHQRQLEENRSRAGNLGAPREGSALLGGLLVCGHCNARMIVSYAGAKTKLTYVCHRQRDCYGLDRCQGVAGKVLDDLVSRQALSVLEPAVLELSMAAAADVDRERKRLEEHWGQRRERARYDVERAARQYHAVEPENRLVARELERHWEQAMLDHRSLEEEYARFRQTQPSQLTDSDRRLIESLATDIPALWNSPRTTPADRQVILRHLIDRIVVQVHDHTELVDVTIHWAGGFSSQHEVLRPVARYDQLRDFDRLKARIAELRQAGCSSPCIAQHLNRGGFRPPRRAKRYNGEMVRQILSRYLRVKSKAAHQEHSQSLNLTSNEWTLDGLARKLSIARPTLYSWLRREWINARKVSTRIGSRWIIWAGDDECQRLLLLHASPLGRSKAEQSPALVSPKPRSEQ